MKHSITLFFIALFVPFIINGCSDESKSIDSNNNDAFFNNDISDSKQQDEFFANDLLKNDSKSDLETIEQTKPLAVDYVDPFIGTGGEGALVASGYPGAVAPFGMVKVSPDTEKEHGAISGYHCAGYYYTDEYIQGFSHLHIHGTGAPDYGSILFMPLMEGSKAMFSPKKYRSFYDKETEKAQPGYYSVRLLNYGIKAELTATTRCAIHRYTYTQNKGTGAYILIDNGHSLFGEVTDGKINVDTKNNVITGFHHNKGSLSGRSGGYSVYYYAVFNTPFTKHLLYDGENTVESDNVSGSNVKVILKFKLPENKTVVAKVGISFVSIENAKANFEKEIKDYDFDTIKEQTRQAWQKELKTVNIDCTTENKDKCKLFYTGLYHTMQNPTIFSDVNGEYIGFDKKKHKAEGFIYYTDFSMWDTFRTENPLLTLLKPTRHSNMIRSLLKMAEQGGYLPKWAIATGYTNCMIGTHSDSVIGDAIVKGLQGFDVEEAYKDIKKVATEPTDPNQHYSGRSGIVDYLKYKFLPADKHNSSVSKTLEYAYEDWVIAQIAKKLGKNDDYDYFMKRSKYYKNVWDADLGFFVGHNSDGTWTDKDFKETYWQKYYTEGTAWQYLWFVPQDINGLAELMGGKDKLIEKLEYFFDKTQEEHAGLDNVTKAFPGKYYWHGNEPDIHASYIFAMAGKPALTQKWARWILDSLYKDTFDGSPGNDDCGTLSAWYVFSALGFFPIPGFDYYIIGSPVFKKATITLKNGVTFTISAPNASKENMYIKSVKLNNKVIDKPILYHKDIMSGGTLEFEMVSKPTTWGED